MTLADDVAEDAAARRVAAALAGSNLRCSGAASGRVNLAARVRGVLRVDADRLLQVNALPGITVATLANHSPVQARQLAATVKIVPFAVPDALVCACEAVAAAHTGSQRLKAAAQCRPKIRNDARTGR